MATEKDCKSHTGAIPWVCMPGQVLHVLPDIPVLVHKKKVTETRLH